MYGQPHLSKAMCHALNPNERVALCFELPADGSAPEWIQLIPPGEQIQGNDGRSWINDNPQGVLDYFTALQSKGRDLPIDWEHSTELKAPNGEEAPTAAWAINMEIREGGSIWAKVDWNERGLNSVKSREYRYISPVLVYHKKTFQIIGIDSVGLTNKPNLHLIALNASMNIPLTNEQEIAMNEAQKIRALLGLGDKATTEELETAINSMKSEHATALNAANNPSLDKFVPRTDFDTAMNRAQTAEDKLKKQADTKRDDEIDTAINSALEAGVITPATKEYHTAACREEGGLERFSEFVKAAPVIGDDTGLDKKVPGEDGKALNAEEQKVAGMFGNSAEDIAKFGTAQA